MDDIMRVPYVGEGPDGCRRSAQVDREEADTLDDTDERKALLLLSADDWERQAKRLEPVDSAPAVTVKLTGTREQRDYTVTGADPVVPPAGSRYEGKLIQPKRLWVERRDGKVATVGITGPRLLATGKPGHEVTVHWWPNIKPGLQGVPAWVVPYVHDEEAGGDP